METPPPQTQKRQPGREYAMDPGPRYEPRYPGVGRFEGKVVLISGGDSGIGRATAVAFAREEAKVAFIYLEEERDAEETAGLVENEGAEALPIRGDIGSERFCQDAIDVTLTRFGRLDVLINNAAEQHVRQSLETIELEQIERTFRTNVFGYFSLTKAALPHLRPGSSIVNTTSITAYQGHPQLLDYAATRGAIVAFTRSLSQALVERGIRVNGVAPGPIWTPLIPATFDEKKVEQHGKSVPMGRVGQPNEVAPCFVFLASDEASYITGQVLHPNGGAIVNG